VAIGAPSSTSTKTGPVSYTVTYSGAASVTLATGNITLNKTGTANGTVAVSGSGTSTRTVTISSITGSGTLGISIAANTATDNAGNAASAPTASQTFTVDGTAPTIAIGAPSSTLTRTGPVTYTVSYSGADSVTLAGTDITLNRTGTANGTVAVSGSGTSTRTVTLSSINGDGTLGITVGANTAYDAAGNFAPASGPSATFTVDNTAPTVTIGPPSTASTKTGPVTYTVTYSGADSVTLATSNITLNKTGTANGTVAVSGSGTSTRTITIASITGTGTLGVFIGASTAYDAAGNYAPASGPSATFNVDNTVPNAMTVSIGAPSTSVTTSGPVSYAVVYSGADSVTLASSHITLNKTGTANGTVAVSGSGTSSRTITISSITGDGTLGVSIAANTARDSAGNYAPASDPSQTFVVDNTAPTLSIGAPSTTSTSTGPVTYKVTYSEAGSVTLASSDITLNKTGTANGTVVVSGSGTSSRTITIASITGDGTLGVTIGANTASDAAGNFASASGASATFTVQNVGLSVSVGSPTPTSTKNGPVTYTVTYTSAVRVTLTSDFVTLNRTGTANGLVSVSGSDTTTRTVTISSITGEGTIGITIAPNTARDAQGNYAPGSAPSATVNVGNIGPTLTLGAPSTSLTRTGPVTYTVTYTGADSVTLASSDITLNKTGTANGTLAVSGSGTSTRTVTLASITGDGTLGITIAANTARDSTGNYAPASAPSQTFTVDNTAPTISVGAPSSTSTKTGPVSYTVTYSGADSVTLATGNITLNKTGTANGTVAVSGSGTSTRTVTISSITGTGTLGIAIAANTASDSAGNYVAASASSATFAVDNTPVNTMTVTVGPPSTTLRRAGSSVTYAVTYTGASTVTLSSADVTLNKTGTANGTVAVSGSGTTTRTITISSITGDGTLGVTVEANTARDSAGNYAPASAPSQTFTVDNTAPTLSIGAPSASSTETGPTTYVVTYSGADSVTLTSSDITLNKTGTANGTVAVSGSGTSTRTITISSITGTGSLGISIAAGTATDAAGNSAPAPGASTSFTVGTVGLTVSVGPPSTTSTQSGPVTYTVTYTNAARVSLTTDYITLNKTGTAYGYVTVSGSGTATRTITISSIAGNGTLGVTIAPNTARDAQGNYAAGSAPSATFTVGDLSLSASGRWYVDGSTSASGEGDNWKGAFKTLQEAVDAASNGDEIWVKASTYHLTAPVTVDKAVTIYGGFSGNETERDQRNWHTYTTKLDGQDATPCLLISDNATIDGLVLVGGKGSLGGAVLNSGAVVGFVNCVFTGNRASTGGAAYNLDAKVTFANCVFYKNRATRGAAIYSDNSLTSVSNCSFSRNKASRHGGTVGNSSDGTLNVDSSILWGDTGGELADEGGQVSVTYSDIQGGHPGLGNIKVNPRFVDADSGVLSLRRSSRCIDRGRPSDSGTPLDEKDLAGNPRIVDGNDDGKHRVDMGAFEFQPD
jgi:hypothetical protein